MGAAALSSSPPLKTGLFYRFFKCHHSSNPASLFFVFTPPHFQITTNLLHFPHTTIPSVVSSILLHQSIIYTHLPALLGVIFRRATTFYLSIRSLVKGLFSPDPHYCNSSFLTTSHSSLIGSQIPISAIRLHYSHTLRSISPFMEPLYTDVFRPQIPAHFDQYAGFYPYSHYHNI